MWEHRRSLLRMLMSPPDLILLDYFIGCAVIALKVYTASQPVEQCSGERLQPHGHSAAA